MVDINPFDGNAWENLRGAEQSFPLLGIASGFLDTDARDLKRHQSGRE